MRWFTVHVGGQKWGVHLVPAKSKFLIDNPDERTAGQTFCTKCRIYVSRDLDAQAREDTLIHELLHATLYVSGAYNALLDACDGDAAKADKAEEQIILCLTPTLHRLVKDLGFRFPKGPNDT